MIDTQDTQPLPLFSHSAYAQETPPERYQRLKAFSEATGVRLLFVYLSDEKQRLKTMGKKNLFAYLPKQGGMYE